VKPATALLSASEIAAILKIPAKKVYDLLREEGLPCYRIGRRVRYDPGEFERWLSTRKGPA
jgi:excisionase family DNA binding protein